MGYAEQNLLPGENIVYRTKLHWIIFFWPVLFLLIALIGFASKSEYVVVGSIILAFLIGIELIIEYLTSEFVITNKRVLVKYGLIRRKSFEILLTKIEGIYVEQGIIGRILNYGTVIVTGTGGNKNIFPKISAPLEFRKKIQEQIEKISIS